MGRGQGWAKASSSTQSRIEFSVVPTRVGVNRAPEVGPQPVLLRLAGISDRFPTVIQRKPLLSTPFSADKITVEHPSDDLLARYSMSRLTEAEIAPLKEHSADLREVPEYRCADGLESGGNPGGRQTGSSQV
jgi:hypothetical protein